jgi:hypothetical protein
VESLLGARPLWISRCTRRNNRRLPLKEECVQFSDSWSEFFPRGTVRLRWLADDTRDRFGAVGPFDSRFCFRESL